MTITEDNPIGTFEDAEDEEPNEKPMKGRPFEDLGDIGWSEDEKAINLRAMVTYSGQRAGTTDVAPELRFKTPMDSETLTDLGDILGQLPLTVTFAGRTAGSGGLLKGFRAAANDDGERFIEALIRFPSNQAKTAVQMGLYVRKAGILAIVPDQLSMDLTKRAE